MSCLIIAIVFLGSLIQAVPQIYGTNILDGRIVGGRPTFIEEYPYQASLQYSSYHRCGATVISKEYVLTVAHCTFGYSVAYLTVRAATTLRNTGGVVIKVATVYQHENYNNATYDYDISVLRLASFLPLGLLVAPVPLPEPNQPIEVGSIGEVSGWGLLTESGNTDWQLQVVEVPIVSMGECRASHGINRITERMICAGFREGGKDSCDGDSGGPLVVNGTLIGLVSWRYGCARPGLPGVYTNVPIIREFITKVTGF